MLNRALSNRRLLLMTLGLTYIAMGMLGALPGASLIQLARNTHVSLEVAGGMFTSSSFGDLLGAALSGFLMRSIKPKYLLMLGLFFGAQVLRQGWISEKHFLYTALLGGFFWSVIAAIFTGHVLISYVASALVGCFYGPLFPCIMAITSRRFVHAIGPVSSIF